MRACRLSGHARLLLTGRWLAVLAVTAGMTAAGVFPEAASAALRLPRAAPGPVGSIFQQATLTAADAAAGDMFGYSVAVSGSTAVVGAPFSNSGTGAAYVFRRSGASWAQQAELTATGAATDDEFGTSVALSGSTAVVGAPFGNSGTGAAYVFRRSGAGWAQQAELTAADGAGGDFFGYSVALSRSTVLVGAFGKNTATGAAYVFRRSGARWAQQAELTAADGTARENFGYSVALSRSTAVAGAPPSEESDTHTGAAYVFARA